MVPENLRFLPTHEWCRPAGEFVLIGVSEFAVGPLGSVIYIDLPEVGDDVLREVPFGEIEGTTDVKDLRSPFDGKIQEVNNRVVLNPEILLKDPYEQGWLIKLKPDTSPQFDNLLSSADYEELMRKRKGK
jgi:glycine cleavage system H protein